MRHSLSDERRAQLRSGLIARFQRDFEEDLSEFRADVILDYLLEHLGTTVYNQAIADARAWMQQRLDDLDVEFHKVEERP